MNEWQKRSQQNLFYQLSCNITDFTCTFAETSPIFLEFESALWHARRWLKFCSEGLFLFAANFFRWKSGRRLEGSLVLLILSKHSWKKLQLKIRDVESHAFSALEFLSHMGKDPISTIPILSYCNSCIFTRDVPEMLKYKDNRCSHNI